MLTLNIPFTTPIITIALPNAELSNQLTKANRMTATQAMDGGSYTYVRTNDLTHLGLTVNASRTLLDSVLSALDTNGSDEWKVTDHEARVWRVRVLVTPMQITMDRVQIQALPCDEMGSINLEFIGTLQP